MKLSFLLRMPKFPVIIGRGDALFSVRSPRMLLKVIGEEIHGVEGEQIVFIDSTGEEFKYFPDLESFAPPLFSKRWTKKRIIELYNSSLNATKSSTSYSERSLSAKTYSKIFNDIADLIRKNRP